ncbi:NAD(P)-binding protein [Stipitochalara longipes BDJ]|nr:NAD(P)-binding protein [Stipitochalara longipes BDJ]
MSQRLMDKVAIVTGSSSGIGRAIAILYAREGAKVVCSDLAPSQHSTDTGKTIKNTHEMIQESGGKAIFQKTDVSNTKDMEALVHSAVEAFGRVDILVNNAGVSFEARNPAILHLTDENTWDKTMDINAKSVFLGGKYAITQMLQQELHPPGDRGWIVNISSIMSIVAGTENPSYCTSKGAVSSLTRQAALDYAKDKIHVNAICPGFTQTAMLSTETTTNLTQEGELSKRHPFNGLGLPNDIAKMAVVLASDDASWMTGACILIDGGYTAR